MAYTDKNDIALCAVPIDACKHQQLTETKLDGSVIETLPHASSGTGQDFSDMARMGKQQELLRNFNFVAIFGYSLILGNAWVVSLVTSILGLTNGGTAGTIWSFIVVACGTFCSTLSMAEMASMGRTAGGQYHWVSEFAPTRFQKFLSFVVGWMCVLGWQTAMSASAYTPALTFQGLIAINMDDYMLPGWQAYLLTLAILIVSILINIFLIRKLPLLEGLMVAFFFLSFATLLIVLWVKGDRASAADVFTGFSNDAGWSSVVLAALIGGLQGGFASLMGSDSAAHLSEELVDASYYLPRSMICTALANYLTAIVMIISLMFTLGSTVNELTGTAYGQPYIQVFYNATKSKAGASALTLIVAILLLFTSINQVTITSRQLFAFAQDNGLPFSDFLKKVHPKWNIPINALIVTFLFTFISSFVIIGSTIAFNILVTLSSIGLLTSYIICIACILVKRMGHADDLSRGRFSRGRYGVAINVIAILFLSLIYIFLSFPATPDPSPSDMNWTILIYGVVWIGCLVYYLSRGKQRYQAPVDNVRKLE